jgi:enamine deaminase RidA (YjgF/YER057c/UK114 family)
MTEPTLSQRLTALGISLPPPAPPVGSYTLARRHGDLLHLSGHIAHRAGAVVTGRVGEEVTTEEARALAREVAIALLATAAAQAGGPDRLGGVVKLTAFVRSAPGFTDQPAVANGASDLFLELFGADGRHARSAVGVSELPLGACLEIEAIFSIRERAAETEIDAEAGALRPG